MSERCEHRGCNVPATFQEHRGKATCGNHRCNRPRKAKGLHIAGRRWFQKTYGSTYHTVEVFKNGKRIVKLGPTYGYEEAYKQTAADWLGLNGYPQFGERYLQGNSYRFWGSDWREAGITCSVADVGRECDL